MEKRLLASAAQAALIAAIEESGGAITSTYVHLGGGYVQEDPHLIWVTTGTPLSFLNGVSRAARALGYHMAALYASEMGAPSTDGWASETISRAAAASGGPGAKSMGLFDIF